MTARLALKRALLLIHDNDRRIWFGRRDMIRAVELAATGAEERIEALDMLEAQASPSHAAAVRATDRWTASQTDTDAARAIQLWQAPGAGQTLEAWLAVPGRKLGEVLELFTRAINKARSE